MVSELMLQQTQVDRVIDRFPRFLERFPTVEDLARASLAEVLTEWSGLGYNRRAANLHRAAELVSAGSWPEDLEGLMALPGVGPYTAAAIGSICFNIPAPAIDTNLRRVLSRWHGVPLTNSEAREYAAPLIDPERPGDWNQALMDLSAAICTVRDPACDVCSAEGWCADASIYLAPKSQGPFAGSTREARGAVVRLLIDGAQTLEELATASDLDTERMAAACDALAGEGLIESAGDQYRLR